jgi:hypothetical protein
MHKQSFLSADGQPLFGATRTGEAGSTVDIAMQSTPIKYRGLPLSVFGEGKAAAFQVHFRVLPSRREAL